MMMTKHDCKQGDCRNNLKQYSWLLNKRGVGITGRVWKCVVINMRKWEQAGRGWKMTENVIENAMGCEVYRMRQHWTIQLMEAAWYSLWLLLLADQVSPLKYSLLISYIVILIGGRG